MSRAEILADTLARLEAERYLPPTPRPPIELEPVTPEQAATNRQILLDAISGDPVVVAWREAV